MKKKTSDENEASSSSPDYIDWQTFNQMVAKQGAADPTRDSRGDTAFDENLEVRMGENFPNTVSDEEDELEFGDEDADLEESEDDDSGVSARSGIVADSHSTLVNDMVDPEDLMDEQVAVRNSNRPAARSEQPHRDRSL